MTIIELARQAGFKVFDGRIVAADGLISGEASASVAALVAIVAEECADVCDEYSDYDYENMNMAWNCASAIRKKFWIEGE